MFRNVSSVTSSRNHVTTGAEARRKTKIHLDRLTKRYGDKATITTSGWNDDNITTDIEFKGQKVQLVCSVNDNTIDVVIHVPLIVVPFRSKIKDRLESELTKVLAIK